MMTPLPVCLQMGSLPDLSILRGDAVPTPTGPQLLHRLLEDVAAGSSANQPAMLYKGKQVSQTLHLLAVFSV